MGYSAFRGIALELGVALGSRPPQLFDSELGVRRGGNILSVGVGDGHADRRPRIIRSVLASVILRGASWLANSRRSSVSKGETPSSNTVEQSTTVM